MHSFNDNYGTVTMNKALSLGPGEKQREKTQHQRTIVEKLNMHIINSKQETKYSVPGNDTESATENDKYSVQAERLP